MKNDSEDLLLPSRHHYLLAHHALRGACMSSPREFFDAVRSPHRQEVLKNLWNQDCSRCLHCEPPSFGIDDVTMREYTVGGRPSVMVIMPPPDGVGEAHFVGIIFARDGQEVEHYITLEMAASGKTVLGEWTTGGHHQNHGRGPQPVLAEFILSLESLIG
jgi:hypothetical protein